MSVKQRLSLKAGKRLGLLPHVRAILSSGFDFLGDLEYLAPIPRNKFGQIRRNLWSYVDPSPPCPSDALPGPDARMDFLREQWRLHKSAVLSWHVDRHRDGSRPWAFWAFGDAPEKYPPFLPTGGAAADHRAARERQRLEALAILVRHNLLSKEEQLLIQSRDAANAALRSAPGEDAPEEK